MAIMKNFETLRNENNQFIYKSYEIKESDDQLRVHFVYELRESDKSTQFHHYISLKKDAKINIDTKHPEFSDFKFVGVDEVLGLSASFKQDVYKTVIQYFKNEGYL